MDGSIEELMIVSIYDTIFGNLKYRSICFISGICYNVTLDVFTSNYAI
jgi:hypothetical protein